uniref:ATP synthase complex subunit 8 n=1 Tax=Staphylinidae sp. BMNH 1274674 TaxID=1796592 RepID=A0A126TE96_9COLE|nr:ATP synthase F0 subunit 8 [Staphylinidae sp. BMNH 1274674]
MYIPQMAPMNWLCLFMLFIMVFMMFNALNYFCFLYPPKNSHISMKKIQKNWKW